jgi:hypothetical protein
MFCHDSALDPGLQQHMFTPPQTAIVFDCAVRMDLKEPSHAEGVHILLIALAAVLALRHNLITSTSIKERQLWACLHRAATSLLYIAATMPA